MKKNKNIYLLIFSVIIYMGVISNVYAANNPYNQSGPYGTNCTWYAWNMAYQKAGVVLPGWGNAKDWYNDAINSGYSVGTTPRANSIVVWGGWTSYGHVGYVESVDGDTIYVWDSASSCADENDPEYIECLKNSVCEETDRACYQNAKKAACAYTVNPDLYGVTGYIYLDIAPTAPKNQTNNNTYQENTTSTIIEEKSNNANLSGITLSVGELSFSKEISDYTVEVENEVESITVDATKEDEKAKIDGVDEYQLAVGENIIKLTVTAEDGTTKDYQIKVIRMERALVEDEVDELESTVTNNTNNESNISFKYIIYAVIVVIVILIFLLCFIIIRRKGKKKKRKKKD